MTRLLKSDVTGGKQLNRVTVKMTQSISTSELYSVNSMSLRRNDKNKAKKPTVVWNFIPQDDKNKTGDPLPP